MGIDKEVMSLVDKETSDTSFLIFYINCLKINLSLEIEK